MHAAEIISEADLKDFMARHNKKYLDFVVTSPTYWDVSHESRKKTVLPPEKHPFQYSELKQDIGNIHDYREFLGSLKEIFERVHNLLHPGKYCAIVTMDIRKGDKVYPLHSDLIDLMTYIRFSYRDVSLYGIEIENAIICAQGAVLQPS